MIPPVRSTAPLALILASVALALVAACAPARTAIPGPERTPVQLDDLQLRRIAQLLRHEDRRRYDPDLFDRLADGSVEVRRRTALAAGRIGDTAAASLLVRLLDDDPNPDVRADAAFALGELADTSRVVIESLREAVPSGWVPVRRGETAVAVEVIHALGKLGTFAARGMVVDALRGAHPGDTPASRRVAAAALLSVWRFDDGPGRVNAVVRYLDAEDPELRWRAAYALMRLGAPEASTRILGRLQDADHRVRANAARGLSAPNADSAGIRDSALVALTAALADGHPHVRINAVRSLAGYGEDAPVDAMAALLGAENTHVAVAAAGALAGFVERAESALLAVATDPARRYALRAATARPLAGVRPDTVRAALEAWADGGFEARYAAARTLDAVGWQRGRGLFRRLSADADSRVAVAAVVVAARLAADTAAPAARRASIRAFLEEAASGDRRRVTIVAVRGLEPFLDSAGVDSVRARWEIADEETRADGRPEAFYEGVARRYMAPALATGARPEAVIRTAGGEIVVELLSAEAPLTVHNFVTLARDGYWQGGVWHRVIPNFVLQDGAPAGDPNGGPGWRIRDEINRVRYGRGVMGMALSGPDTGGSQWFITHSPQHHLDGGYTIFGRVIDGMDVADRVLQGDPIESIRVRQ